MKISPDKIGFDFDGVIADIGEAFIRLACEEHGYCSFALEDITDFHVEKCTNVPESIVQQIFSDILNDSLVTGLVPISGALKVLSQLSQHAQVTIITARDEEAPVADWLANYLEEDVYRKIKLIAMSDHDQKVRFIQQEKIEFFVDDRAETCVQVAGAELTPILFRQPWNSRWNSFATVENWQDISLLLDIQKVNRNQS